MPASTQAMTYDADGNLTFDGVWIYTWDAENRLIEMTMTNFGNLALSNQLRLDFAYDYMNRRISKIVSTNTGSGFVEQSANYFIYDGWNLIAIFDPSSTVRQSFVWGNDLSGTVTKAGGIGGLLISIVSGTNLFAGYDGNGNLVALIHDLDASIAAMYEYNGFGETIRATGRCADFNPFCFSTKFRDRETTLIYYGCRYFSQALSRWISRDPSFEEGGLNLYAFGHNSMINGFDPDGKLFIDFLFSTFLGIKDDAQRAAFYAGVYARVTWNLPILGSLAAVVASTRPSDIVQQGYISAGEFTPVAARAYAGTMTFLLENADKIQGAYSFATGYYDVDDGSPPDLKNLAGTALNKIVETQGEIIKDEEDENNASFDAEMDYWSNPNPNHPD